MTRNELIEALADYFEIEYPDTDDNGNYRVSGYDWESGCSMGRGRTWLTLRNVVYALEDLCEEER